MAEHKSAQEKKREKRRRHRQNKQMRKWAEKLDAQLDWAERHYGCACPPPKALFD